jgi:hypothetical protein
MSELGFCGLRQVKSRRLPKAIALTHDWSQFHWSITRTGILRRILWNYPRELGLPASSKGLGIQVLLTRFGPGLIIGGPR